MTRRELWEMIGREELRGGGGGGGVGNYHIKVTWMLIGKFELNP